MRFMFDGKDISNLVGKEVIWSGRLEKVINVVYWKEEIATVVGLVQNWEHKPALEVVDEQGTVLTWTEDQFNKMVHEIRECTAAEKEQILSERKAKAEKNFRNAVVELINGYPALSLDDKKLIIHSYLSN